MPRAIQVSEAGGPGVLQLAEVDVGDPAPGCVQVRVAAAGVNFIDVYMRTGLYPRPLPYVAGLEAAGRIEQVGPEVSGFATGDRVAWSGVPGSYAEVVNAPAAQIVKVPDGVDDRSAAAVMLQGMTAHYLAHGTRSPKEGDRALVHAAAGGTGLLLVQTLTRAGVRVIGTCSSQEKADLARRAGAEDVIRYDEIDFAEQVQSITDGAGVDVVYDSVGKDTFEGSLRSLRPRGLLCCFGQSSGSVPGFDIARLNPLGSLFITRPSLAHYIATREELEMRAGAVLGAVDRGDLDVRIGGTYELEDADQAHRDLEGRGTTGKLLLTF